MSHLDAMRREGRAGQTAPEEWGCWRCDIHHATDWTCICDRDCGHPLCAEARCAHGGERWRCQSGVYRRFDTTEPTCVRVSERVEIAGYRPVDVDRYVDEIESLIPGVAFTPWQRQLLRQWAQLRHNIMTELPPPTGELHASLQPVLPSRRRRDTGRHRGPAATLWWTDEPFEFEFVTGRRRAIRRMHAAYRRRQLARRSRGRRR